MNNVPKQGISEAFESPIAIEPKKIKYVLYARKSTESEERQVLSIDSQIKEMLAMDEKDRLEMVEIEKESHSAEEAGQRPVFNEIVEGIKSGRFSPVISTLALRFHRKSGVILSLGLTRKS